MGREGPDPGKAIVVGVDASERTRRAIEWAAREGALRRIPVRIVHAFVWPLLRIPPVLAAMGPSGGLHAQANELLAESVKVAESAAPGVRVESYLRTAFPDDLLVVESQNASYVVLGSRDLGTLGRLLIGSTTMRLIVRSRCPVVVVGDHMPVPGVGTPVIVGVDESSHSLGALRAGIDLAVHQRTDLQVVHVVPSRRSGQRIDIDQMIAPWQETCPDMDIRALLLEGRPGDVLADLSNAARAVAVGARGMGGARSLLIGSVSQTVISRARCPVVVVPTRSGGGPSPS